MAKADTNTISVSGLTISVNDEGKPKIKAKGGTKLSILTKKDEATQLVVNKSVKYILTDDALFTGKLTDVSLFGAATSFDATDSNFSTIKNINASVIEGSTELIGNDNANLIVASKDGSTMDGGAGNDTLTGGDGADTFIYSAGNDVIKKFSATDDTLQINGAAVTDGSVSGSNVVLKIGKNTLTVEGMAKKELTFTDDDGTKIFKGGIFYDDAKTSATLASSFSSKSKVKIDTDNIDASAVKNGVNLLANSSNNYILGGIKNDTIDGGAGDDEIYGGKGNDKLYGNAGDDTLVGGAGNDSLWGGDGADTFIYAKGDGKDVIVGFSSEDFLTFDDIEFTSATVNNKGTEVTLKLGSGSVTFKDFSSGTDFNIDGDIYHVVATGKNKYSFEKE
jgi:Ca2+-binding RTX toxin-like protein